MNKFFIIYALVLYALVAFLFIGCARKPGQPFPFTTSSYAEDDVIYNGVGVAW